MKKFIQEEVRSIELDRNKKFFEAWQKESESTLIFLQENGKAITTDGTKLRVDMPSKLLLDLRNGYNIGKLVSLDYNQKKKDDSTIVLFNSYLFKLNFCKVPFEQDEQLYRRKREKQYGSSC